MKNNKKIIIPMLIIIIITALSALMFSLHKNAEEKKQEYRNKIEYYKAIVEVEKKWISENQVANGALLYYKEKTGTTSVVPYFSNTAAKSLLGQTFDADHKDVILKYLNWYFSHLNNKEQDKINGAGTIYNYKIMMKNNSIVSEESTNKYDSVDSYAASFLMLLNSYYEKTEDTHYIIDNMDKIFIIIDALENTIDSNGLSKTDEEARIKYLMDNTEVNMALKDTINLLEVLSQKKEYQDSAYYNKGNDLINELTKLKSKNTSAIEENLWNQDENRYEIGLDKNNKKFDFIGWNNFYSDAVAQLFPIAFGVIEPESERARALYETFCNEYQWENFEHYINKDSSFYWSVLAYVGAVMGDETRVNKFISYYSDNIAIDHKYPLYIADSGWYIMACDKMIEMNEKKIQEVGYFGIS